MTCWPPAKEGRIWATLELDANIGSMGKQKKSIQAQN